MTVATLPAQPLSLPIAASLASGVARHDQGIKTPGLVRRAARLIEDGVLVVLLAYVVAIAMIAVCLPLALLFAVARWLGS